VWRPDVARRRPIGEVGSKKKPAAVFARARCFLRCWHHAGDLPDKSNSLCYAPVATNALRSLLRERLDPAREPVVHVVGGCRGSIGKARDKWRQRIVGHRLAAERPRRNVPLRLGLRLIQYAEKSQTAVWRTDEAAQDSDVTWVGLRRVVAL